MSVESESEDDNAEREADRKSEAMKSQLRDDVNSWTKARNEASPGHIPGQIAEPKTSLGRAISPQPVAGTSSPQPVAGTRKAASAPPAVRPAATPSKPFSMSYGGETTKDYMQYMISRGVR
jgi:hypothetical protein